MDFFFYNSTNNNYLVVKNKQLCRKGTKFNCLEHFQSETITSSKRFSPNDHYVVGDSEVPFPLRGWHVPCCSESAVL